MKFFGKSETQFQALADLVVRHLQPGARRHGGLVLHRLGLVLAEAMQVLGLGRVMAVAVDDHVIRRVRGSESGRMLRRGP
jgi:hypothetical protein